MGPKNRDPKISMKQVILANIWEIDGTLDLKRILIPSIFILFLANGTEAHPGLPPLAFASARRASGHHQDPIPNNQRIPQYDNLN
jgi:hypothetical protein